MARPGVKRAGDADGDDGHVDALDQQVNARTERLHLAVGGALPFGIDNHGMPCLKLVEYGLEPFAGKAFLINRDTVQAAHQPAQPPVMKKGSPGQVVQVPPCRQADQDRIEKALMIGNEQSRARRRHVPVTLGTQAEGQGHAGEGEPEAGLVPAVRKPVAPIVGRGSARDRRRRGHYRWIGFANFFHSCQARGILSESVRKGVWNPRSRRKTLLDVLVPRFQTPFRTDSYFMRRRTSSSIRFTTSSRLMLVLSRTIASAARTTGAGLR